ncbi:unnamed protein product [Penicillium palitans]
MIYIVVAATPAAGKGKDKGKDKGKAKDPGTPTKPAKKRAAPGPADDGSKQKKKTLLLGLTPRLA